MIRFTSEVAAIPTTRSTIDTAAESAQTGKTPDDIGSSRLKPRERSGRVGEAIRFDAQSLQ